MPKKKTHEEFVASVYQAVGDEYTVIGQYVNSRTRVEMKHNLCGHTYFVTPNDFRDGSRCIKCGRKAAASKLAKTHEQFQDEVRSLVGDEYEVLSPYINANTHVQIKHNVCGHTYPVKPANFLSGKRCSECANKQIALKNTKTHEQYCEEVRHKVGDEFQVLTPYKGVNEMVEILHTVCEKTFETGARNFLRNPSCHHCQTGTRPLSQEEFCKRVYDLYGDEYTVLGEYRTKEHLILMKHNVCGHKYEMLAGDVLCGKLCKKCGMYRHERVEKAFFNAIELTDGEYSLVDEYVNSVTHVQMRHNACGHTYPIKPGDFTRGNRCPECCGSRKLTQEEFETMVKEQGKGEYKVVGEYINNNTHILLKHLVCGNVYPVKPSNFKSGNRCPKCNQSHGEQQVEDYLKEHGFIYECQYRYKDCRNVKPLPFDFALMDDAGEVRCLIEFDGEQHFFAIDYFGGKEGLERNKKSDGIKNDYCKDHKIILIRIPYLMIDYVDRALTYWLKYYEII